MEDLLRLNNIYGGQDNNEKVIDEIVDDKHTVKLFVEEKATDALVEKAEASNVS